MPRLPPARLVRDRPREPGTAGEAPHRVLRLGPRDLPTRLLLRVLLGSTAAKFGWSFAAFGMIFVVIGLPLSSSPFEDTFDRDAMAEITAVGKTDQADTGGSIFRVDYKFVDERGLSRSGAGYTHTPGRVGSLAPVAYQDDNPASSRLANTREKPFSWSAIPILLALPMIGLAYALRSLRAGRRDLRLLRFGIETRGKLVAKTEKHPWLDRKPTFSLTFEYELEPGGRTYRATVKTEEPSLLEDDSQEPMLYDPEDPNHAMTLDHLPGSPRVVNEELESPPGIAVHLLLWPILVVVGIGVTIVRMV